ncbi:MAG: periplasmic heavy metal sensor [Candidatus Krumholzibacteriota bacterium]|nr:periplasmic heavy metal sensor [Candidatus Krumholzibacteriota bacterium]
MSNRLVGVLLVLSLAFNLAVAASLGWLWISRERETGDSAPHVSAPDPCGPACRMLSRRMGLRGERAELVHRIMGQSLETTRDLRERIGADRRRLVVLLTGDEPDSAAIMQTVDDISTLQGELEKVLVERLMKVRSVLDESEMHIFHRMLGETAGPPPGEARHTGHSRRHEPGGTR